MIRKFLVAFVASVVLIGAMAMPSAAQDAATPGATPVVTPTVGATEAPPQDNDHHHHHQKPGEKAAPNTASALPNTGSGGSSDPGIAIGFAVIAAGVLAGAGIFVRQRRRDLTL